MPEVGLFPPPPPPPPPPPEDSETWRTPNLVPEGSQPKSTITSVLARSSTSIGTEAEEAEEEEAEEEVEEASSKVKSSRLVKVDLRVLVKRATSTAR